MVANSPSPEVGCRTTAATRKIRPPIGPLPNPPTGYAVLGNAFEQGNWRVTLDGRPAECFRVNHAFLGVRLPEAGVHKLHFSYWPRLLTPALWISLGGLLLTAGTAVAGLRRKSSADGEDSAPATETSATAPGAEN